MSYTGIKEIVCKTDEDYIQVYEYSETLKLLTNEYLLVKNTDGQVVDKKRWDGTSLQALRYRSLESRYVDKIKPRSPEQECYFDLLQNQDIVGKLVQGGFGSGKSFLAMAHSIEWVFGNKPKYNKIVFIRNMQLVKELGNHSLGALPGLLHEKIKPFAMQFADFTGSESELDGMIASEKLSLDYLGFCRGRSYTNSCIYLNESENISKDQMALIMSRVGEGSCLIVDGDMNQVDRDLYAGNNSGMKRMIEKLQGNSLFGMVTLQKNERSEFSSLSDLLLE